MPKYRIIFLLLMALASSGYRFRCYWFCTDQTSTQNDYIEQRDRCREYAQLKLDMAMKNAGGSDDEKTSKAQLIQLFSQCMANNGWDVPAGKAEKAAAAGAAPAAAATPAGGAPSAAAVPPKADAVAPAIEAKRALARKAECDFARASAANSSIAANRAKACDLECAQGLHAAPEAPRPSACPSDTTPHLTGVEHTD